MVLIFGASFHIEVEIPTLELQSSVRISPFELAERSRWIVLMQHVIDAIFQPDSVSSVSQPLAKEIIVWCNRVVYGLHDISRLVLHLL